MDTQEQKLTAREYDILKHLVEGENNAVIAEALFISKSTVKTHLENLFRRFNASNRIQLAVIAVRYKLVK